MDETLEIFDPSVIKAGDVVGIGIHTGNALRGYEIGTAARAAGAYVVYGGIHATLYPDEAHDLGGAHSVVTGDGEQAWPMALKDCAAGHPLPRYDGGRIGGETFLPGRWEFLPQGRYMWASVQTVRGCPKHCSFCSVWRTDGQQPRQRHVDRVLEEVVDLRRRGFRFIALADDNFYPVTLEDLRMAARRSDKSHLEQLKATRAERFELMAGLESLPADTVFFTQITMEAAEDPEFLDAMRRAHIKGALVGVEAVTPEGLKDIYKGFNESGESLVERLQAFRKHGVHVLGSFIFGLPSDREATFDATLSVAERANLTFAQFVMLTPFPGTLDFAAWEKSLGAEPPAGERHPGDAALADSAGAAPQDLHGTSGHERGSDPQSHAGGLGSLLLVPEHLEAIERVGHLDQGTAGVRAHLEDLPSDVCEHGHRHRQRARQPIGAVGALDGHPMPSTVRRAADARPRDPDPVPKPP